MKYFLVLLYSIFIGCYNIYGVALKEEKNNQIPSQEHTNYKISDWPTDIPKSIIS